MKEGNASILLPAVPPSWMAANWDIFRAGIRVITAQKVRYENSSPWAFWILKNQTCSLTCVLPVLRNASHPPRLWLLPTLKSRQGQGKRWKEKPTRKPVTDITQPHTFGRWAGGGTLKSIKQTTRSSLFLPKAEDTNAIYCTAGVLASHSNISTQSTIFPKMTSLHSAE